MNKIILLLIFFTNSSIFSMSQQELDEQLEMELKLGHSDKVDKLLKRGAKASNKTIYSYCTKEGWKLFQAFLNNGFDINEPISEHGDNALMAHIRYFTAYPLHYSEIINLLLQVEGMNIHVVDNEKDNLLHLIFTKKYHSDFLNDLAKELIFRGINVRQRNNKNQTPMTLATGIMAEFLSEYDSFMLENGFYQTCGVDYIAAGQAFREHFGQKKHEKKQCKEHRKRIESERDEIERKRYEKKLSEWLTPIDNVPVPQNNKKKKKRCIIM